MRFIDCFPRLSGWLLFLGGLSAVLVTDYRLRIRDGQVCDGGFPEPVYYGAALFLGLLSLACIWRGARKRPQRWIRLFEALGHLSLGFLVYAAALLCYVVGTGIDSL